MKVVVLANCSAGQISSKKQALLESISAAMRDAKIEAEVHAIPHNRLEAEAKAAAASSADVVVAGGGDGTVRTVASALAGTKKPFGVLPLGTLNHFAKDMGIPLDLAEAARVIAAAKLSAVDVGMVNDHLFINNSSLGIYPRAVLDRELYRRQHGLSKWTAMTIAMIETFRRFPLVNVRLEVGQRTITRKSPLVFVGNNEYQLDLLKIGKRMCLDNGELSLYITNTQTRWGMLALTVRAIFGHLKQSRDFEAICLNQCWIETRRRHLHVAIDGDVITLRPPLHYRIWPGALYICTSPIENEPSEVANNLVNESSPLEPLSR
jgi:diacylglycerol kinase family enzyme